MIVDRDGQRIEANEARVRAIDQAIERGVDVGQAAGEGHGGIGRAVAVGKGESNDLTERERAAADRERDLKVVRAGIHVGGRNRVAVGTVEDQVGIGDLALSAWHRIDRRVVDRGDVDHRQRG